jgi:penicillin-binding protein 1C
LPRAPSGAVRIAAADLPLSLRRFVSAGALPAVAATEPAPEIVYPPQGARIDLAASSGDSMPLMLKINGGRAPFRWLANGKPLPQVVRRRTNSWKPDGSGFSTLTVVDAAGRAASVRIFVE